MASSKTIVVKTSATKRVRKAVPTATAAITVIDPTACELAMFVDGGGAFPRFKFIRYFFKGDGPRPSIKPLIDKKRQPGLDPKFGSAAKAEVLIHDEAATEYLDADHLIARFEATHQPWEPNALVQLNFYPEPGQAPHALYERVRSFCRTFFVADGCPVVLTLHVPSHAGHDNDAHCHAQVLPRRLTSMGFGSWNRTLACDVGNRAVHSAWEAYRVDA